MSIFLSQQWRRQPQLAVEPDPYWLSRGLIFAYNGALNSHWARGRRFVQTAGSKLVLPQGVSGVDASISRDEWESLGVATPISIFAVASANKLTGANEFPLVMSNASYNIAARGGVQIGLYGEAGANKDKWYAVTRDASHTQNSALFTVTSATANKSTTFLYRNSSSAVTMLVDGVLGTAPQTFAPGTNDNDPLSIGAAGGSTSIGVACLYRFNQLLTDAEYFDLRANPWQVFRPRQRVLYSLPAGGPTTHVTSGALVAGASLVTGTSSNFTIHSSSGALLASSAVIVGTASNFTVHATSGALVSSSSLVAGSATNFTVHATSGALVASPALITGAADHVVPGATHTTSGALQAQVAQIVGSAFNFTIHSSTGILQSQGALIVGSANHVVPGTTHSTSGALVSGQAVVSGISQHKAKHDTSGALLAGTAIVAGTSQHKAIHSSSGALLAGSSIIVGSASKSFGTTLPQASCIYPLHPTYEAQIDNILIYPQKCSYPGLSQGGGARFIEYWIME